MINHSQQLPPLRKAAIYARVSSSKQQEEKTIESQIEVLLDQARNQDFEVPEGWIFLDNGVSGSTIQRPALDCLRDLVASGCTDTILIYHPDRLARKYVYQVLLLEEFAKNGVEVIFHKNKKAETPEEHLLEQFQGVFAEYERAQITERCRRGRMHKAKQGLANVIPNAPYGYRYIKNNETRQAFYQLHIEESKSVERLFQMFGSEGKGLSELVRYMNENEKKPRKSQSGWDRATIRRMLKNRAYIGLAGFGKTEKCEGNSQRIIRGPKNGRIQISKFARKDRFEEEWITIPVPAIVSEDLYRLVQDKLVNSQKFAARNTRTPSILQGILVCGLCGASYYKKSRTNARTYYTCNRALKKSENRCENRSIRQNELDEYIWEWILSILRDPKLVEKEIKRRLTEDPDKKKLPEKKAAFKRELKKLENSKNKLLDAYTDSDCLTLDELKNRMGILNQNVQRIKREISVIEAQTCDEERIKQNKLTMEAFSKSIASSQLNVEEKQKVIRALIDEVVVYQDSIKIKHCIPMKSNSLPTSEKCPLQIKRSVAAFAAKTSRYT